MKDLHIIVIAHGISIVSQGTPVQFTKSAMIQNCVALAEVECFSHNVCWIVRFSMAASITHYNVLEAWGGKLHSLCFASDATARINQREAHVMLFLSENGFCSRWFSIQKDTVMGFPLCSLHNINIIRGKLLNKKMNVDSCICWKHHPGLVFHAKGRL